jgi:hypothetical protein
VYGRCLRNAPGSSEDIALVGSRLKLPTKTAYLCKAYA